MSRVFLLYHFPEAIIKRIKSSASLLHFFISKRYEAVISTIINMIKTNNTICDNTDGKTDNSFHVSLFPHLTTMYPKMPHKADAGRQIYPSRFHLTPE